MFSETLGENQLHPKFLSCSELYIIFRVVFNCVSKVIRQSLWFWFDCNGLRLTEWSN